MERMEGLARATAFACRGRVGGRRRRPRRRQAGQPNPAPQTRRKAVNPTPNSGVGGLLATWPPCERKWRAGEGGIRGKWARAGRPMAKTPQMHQQQLSAVASSSSSSVLVAVRVRPFNEREKERNAQLVVNMVGRVTELRSPGSGKPRRFTFDHSYWSHDGFRPLADGYLSSAEGGSDYADQQRVFNDLGRQVLQNAWSGYNCTLFAYGQTGSGKSYSVIGFGPNRGLVPMLCDELFRGIQAEQAKEPNAEIQVSISMLEIYCEKVRDLLGDRVNGGGLKVREHPQDGFYVEGLSCWPAGSYREVERRIAEGTRMRSIAATSMNETSSRAHTIVRLHLSQRRKNGGRNEIKSEVKLTLNNTINSNQKKNQQVRYIPVTCIFSLSFWINLVDLAGSERQKGGHEANEGDRLREGIRINQSLSALGRVIKALHERQSRPGATGGQVPYRDSVLTSLLRNALGGNSKTIMMATISPADLHFEETLSTLRFADRVKQIKTQPIVNEAQTERLVRALQRENSRLVDTLRRGGLDGVASQEELEALRRQLADNQREMERLERSWILREEALKKQLNSLSLPMSPSEGLENGRRAKLPHLWNLNEDPALTNLIVHFVEKGESRVGNGTGRPTKLPQILLKGLSIQPEHALFRNQQENRRVTLAPLKGSEVLVNGQSIGGETELQQNDRVHFGGNHLYVFVNPFKSGALPPEKISFDMAQKEIARAGHLMAGGGGANKSKEEQMLEEELVHLLPYVYRANSMAKELRKQVSFEIVLLPPESRGISAGADSGMTEVWVKVQDRREETSFLWDSDRFMSRYYAMQEMYQNHMEGAGDRSGLLVNERDPFHEQSNVAVPLGTATVFLQNLAYLVELDERVPIVDLHGVESGQLSISIRPCSISGREIVGDYVESSEKLIGKNLGIKLKLLSANGLPARVDQSCCKYRFFDQEEVSTGLQPGSNPIYAHERLFPFRPVTQELVDYMMESALVIEVSAIQRTRQQKSLDMTQTANNSNRIEKRNGKEEARTQSNLAKKSEEITGNPRRVSEKSTGNQAQCRKNSTVRKSPATRMITRNVESTAKKASLRRTTDATAVMNGNKISK